MSMCLGFPASRFHGSAFSLPPRLFSWVDVSCPPAGREHPDLATPRWLQVRQRVEFQGATEPAPSSQKPGFMRILRCYLC